MRDNKPFARKSKLGVTSYSKPRKPLMSAEERKRQAQSLRSYKPDGGDTA